MLSLNKIQEYASKHLTEILSSMFKGVDFTDRFTVDREKNQIIKDSLDIHNIKTGKRKEFFSIYFDDEFMCSFTEDYTPTMVDKLFLEGFLEAYESGQIRLTKGLYKEEEAQRKQKEAIEKAAKEAEMKKDFEQLSSDEKQIATEVIKEVTKERGHATA